MFDRTLKIIQAFLPNIKETRWSNKTDFYTLFVAIASILLSFPIDQSQYKSKALRRALDLFAAEVDARIGDKNAEVSQEAIDHVQAVEKGANDKARRAERHRV